MKKWIVSVLAVCLLTGCQARSLPDEQKAAAAPERMPPVRASVPEESNSASQAENTDILQISQPDLEPSVPPTEQILSEPPQETSHVETDSGDWSLILANFENGVGDYTPVLEAVQGQYQMDVRVAGVARQMIADAKAQGVELLVCSAYRPFTSQQRNFDNSVNAYVAAGLSKDRAVTETKRLIAEPGKSEHQTGLAMDVVTPAYQGLDNGYAETGAAKWLLKNAAAYGFILRYPKDKVEITQIDFEPWHYRYVGVDAAKKIMEQGLCLEEYLEAEKGAS